MISGVVTDESRPEQTIRALFSQFNRRDLWSLAWLALLIRLVFLLLSLQTQDISGVSMWADDSQTYMRVADYWLSGDEFGKQRMLIAGPGYGMVLAGLRLVFGTNPWPPLLLNLTLGVLAPIVVYMLAMLLIRRRSVALLAGTISCISWTSVSLSVSQLTDQPFFTLHALALLLFVVGLQTDRTRWFVIAGVVAGIATYIRALGQVWPVVFAFITILFALTHPRPGRWRAFVRALWTSVILLLMIAGWS
jgi:4-amino-4-deoxy-L-arabinose transferase-like glycosyltransferase